MHAPDHRAPRTSLLSSSWALTLSGLLFAGVVAARLPGPPPGEVRQVVQSQLQALAAEDATRAFELADPRLREQFADADAFMAMVRQDYPMIQRPASLLFMAPQSEGSVAFQRVRLVDTEGASWMLTYLLSRDGQRQWRITACVVAPQEPALTV